MTKSPRPNWPPLLAAVANRCGDEAAYRLVREFGGQERTIPINPRPGQVLVERCGMDVARVLADLHGGEKIAIPNGAMMRSKKLAILRASGTVSQIVKLVGCTARFVRMTRSQARQSANDDGDQRRLF